MYDLNAFEWSFDFLDDLRASGQTNMMGAATYLADEMAETPRAVRPLVQAWMTTFDPEMDRDERVLTAYYAQPGAA